jgi:Ca2+:H+ antiporter
MSDILVNTLEGFAQRANLSQVFTSLVVVPYFSNIAEQASAILFAYRNEMDLCIGVSVGSAIQIGALVMPGSVLIGYLMDRSMTLYFHGFETMCYLFSVVVVGAVVQGGTTNWLVGATMIAMYVMMAAGFWVHETEDLSVDAEEFIRNTTGT